MSDETDVSVQNLVLGENDKPSKEVDTPFNEVDTPFNEVDTPFNKVDAPSNEVDKPADEVVKSSSVEPFDWKNLKSDTSLSDAARERVFSLKASNNRSTYRKVEEAIAVIGTGDNGASVPAIVTWILNNYSTLDPSKLKVNVKRAILKGLKGGTLVRAKTSKKALGVSGSFTFPAQRIKLKAVRLEGKKYVFPILQPVSSASNAGDEKSQVSDPVVKRRLSLDASAVKSSPKRVAKKRSKRVVSEISDKTDEVQEIDGRRDGSAFPILQPVSSASNAGDEKPQVSEPVVKRRLSLDASAVKSSPKRLAKKRSKRVVSEISDKTEVQE